MYRDLLVGCPVQVHRKQSKSGEAVSRVLEGPAHVINNAISHAYTLNAAGNITRACDIRASCSTRPESMVTFAKKKCRVGHVSAGDFSLQIALHRLLCDGGVRECYHLQVRQM